MLSLPTLMRIRTTSTHRSLDALRVCAVLGLTLCLSLLAQMAEARSAERLFRNPPPANLQRSDPSLSSPQAEGLRQGKKVIWDLDIEYTEGKIYNPSTGRYDNVRLRSYRNRDAKPGENRPFRFVAPNAEVNPGDTFQVTLHNQLPDNDSSCRPHKGDHNTPSCFNSTNLHTHGLWISPSGNSDNVLISVRPNVSFTYEFNIPEDHPAGTFWYHPHLHGSTALQVSSGMAGALIIRGTRLPSADGGGDIDVILKHHNGQAFKERVVVLQQIQYACYDAQGEIKTIQDDKGKISAWSCDPSDTGVIEDYKQFGPGTWGKSGRHTTLNGEVIPTFTGTVTGEVERWRVIHAGVRETIKVSFRKLTSSEPSAYTAATAEQQQRYIDTHCTGDPVPYLALASDGLTRSQLSEQTVSTLQPGYREDFLTVFPKSGTYCMIDENVQAAQGTVNNQHEPRKLLGYVRVGAGEGMGDKSLTEFVTQKLVEGAQATLPEPNQAQVIRDLQDGLKLTHFVPHQDIKSSKVNQPKQTLAFNIKIENQSVTFEVGNYDFAQRRILRSKPYDPETIDRKLMLGGVQEWWLTSIRGGHPFHIHVNPFQIVEILNKQGEDVSRSGNNTQYAGLKGVWRDTVFVLQDYTIKIRSRYQRYIGDFVLHCHILDHEDKGMMQNVRIALPDGTGGIQSMGHH